LTSEQLSVLAHSQAGKEAFGIFLEGSMTPLLVLVLVANFEG